MSPTVLRRADRPCVQSPQRGGSGSFGAQDGPAGSQHQRRGRRTLSDDDPSWESGWVFARRMRRVVSLYPDVVLRCSMLLDLGGTGRGTGLSRGVFPSIGMSFEMNLIDRTQGFMATTTTSPDSALLYTYRPAALFAAGLASPPFKHDRPRGVPWRERPRDLTESAIRPRPQMWSLTPRCLCLR